MSNPQQTHPPAQPDSRRWWALALAIVALGTLVLLEPSAVPGLTQPM
jgi:hypothetical protein